VFFSQGQGVQAGAHTGDAAVADVAPTVLHAIGEPVPEHVDGRVLTETFDPEAAPATRGVTGVDLDYDATGGEAVDGDVSDVEERLRDLVCIE
jgi:arylsulfatase A-like enzyme